MTYNQLRDIIIERTTALTKCKYQNDINQKKLLEAQARIAELDSALDACLSGKRIPVAVTNRTDDLSALAAHDAEITSKYIHLLSDQDYEYNQKTNALIKRHVEQLVKVRKAALLEAADEIEKLRGGLENTNVALRDARSIVVACRGSVKTDLNAYERLLIAKKKHNEQQTPTYIAAEAEAQRLFDLLAKIDAWALTTPNA